MIVTQMRITESQVLGERISAIEKSTEIGYLEWRWGSGNTVEIVDIGVQEDRRSEGIGQKMVDHLLLYLREGTECLTLWAVTRATNHIAWKFYTRIGFRRIGKLHKFYRDDPKAENIDAIMYGISIERNADENSPRRSNSDGETSELGE